MNKNLLYMAVLNASLSMGSRYSWLTSAIVSSFAENSEHGCLAKFQNSYLEFIGDPAFAPDTKTLLILSNLSSSALLRGDLSGRYKIESIIQNLPAVANDEALLLRSKTRVVFTDFLKGRFHGSFAQLNRIERYLAEITESDFTFGSENYLLLTEAFGALFLKCFNRAENVALRACRRVQKRYGMRSSESAPYKQLLVEVYLGRGEFEKARELNREVLIIRRHYLRADSMELASSYLDAAAIDAETGKYDEAEANLALVEKAYYRAIQNGPHVDFPYLLWAGLGWHTVVETESACYEFRP
ncbi:MAG: tetratricopeptide repeat protein [Cyanobacteriota/Melainabacteria group bacterium]